MAQSSKLLCLPPEIRTAIYHYLFDSPYPIHLRTPSHRRLKSSRIDKSDPRAIFATCRQLRCEALPVFFNLNMLLFRNSLDALEFLNDKDIHPSIKQAVSRIAIDDGDASFRSKNLWQAQCNIVSQLHALPNLETIEFRVYARDDNPDLLRRFKGMQAIWTQACKQVRLIDSQMERGADVIQSDCNGGMPCSNGFRTVVHAGLTVECIFSKARYEVGDKHTFVYLNCENLVVGKPGKTTTILGGADEACPQRTRRVGTMCLRDEITCVRVLDNQ